ncbi:MAG: M23 family metallopeptidase [Candidatus Moranbacteria bacterium]|nr:M23 family metallopeptidase [Candidatus Moranbacteria bacterium]
MKHPGIGRRIGLAVVVVIVFIVLVFFWRKYTNVGEMPVTNRPAPTLDRVQDVPIAEPSSGNETEAEPSAKGAYIFPIERADERVTKKPFGVHITKAASPVQPERFSGYHTGTDFEVFPDETDTDVGISAICDGVLLMKRSASGYGGVAAQSCTYDGRPITVVYGHLRLSSIPVKVGEPIAAGDFLGNLGAGYSSETDGERKHLHLGIHRGDIVDIRGYVTTVRQLSDWIDPYVLIRSQQ